MPSSLKCGDILGGFLVVSTDLKLREAMDRISREISQSRQTGIDPTPLHEERELIATYVRQAVLSPAGVRAFPAWAEEIRRIAVDDQAPDEELVG